MKSKKKRNEHIDPDRMYGVDQAHIEFSPDCEEHKEKDIIIAEIGDVELYCIKPGTYRLYTNDPGKYVRGKNLLGKFKIDK